MTAEVGKKCIAMPNNGEYIYTDGYVPELGDQIMAYPLQGGGYVVMPLPSVSIGDILSLMPSSGYLIPSGLDEESPWTFGGWTYEKGAAGSPVMTIGDDGVGTFGVELHATDVTVWATIEKRMNLASCTHIRATVMSSVTNHPANKRTRIYVDGTKVYDHDYTVDPMGVFYPIEILFSPAHEYPVIKIETIHYHAYHTYFTLGISDFRAW